jgi:hypothetical protein
MLINDVIDEAVRHPPSKFDGRRETSSGSWLETLTGSWSENSLGSWPDTIPRTLMMQFDKDVPHPQQFGQLVMLQRNLHIV